MQFLMVMAQPHNVEVTLMSADNLAMVFAPSFLRCPSEDLNVVMANTGLSPFLVVVPCVEEKNPRSLREVSHGSNASSRLCPNTFPPPPPPSASGIKHTHAIKRAHPRQTNAEPEKLFVKTYLEWYIEDQGGVVDRSERGPVSPAGATATAAGGGGDLIAVASTAATTSTPGALSALGLAAGDGAPPPPAPAPAPAPSTAVTPTPGALPDLPPVPSNGGSAGEQPRCFCFVARLRPF